MIALVPWGHRAMVLRPLEDTGMAVRLGAPCGIASGVQWGAATGNRIKDACHQPLVVIN